MKMTKILAASAAAAVAVSMFAVSTAAYDLNKDLKTGWSVSTTVPADEFEDTTTDTVWTLTYTIDDSLAEKDGHNYWCVKPMINDTGWPFISTLVGPTLSENKDTYVCAPGTTEIKFTIPAEELEHLQTAGMAFMGHGVTLGSLTYSNDETLPAPAETETVAAVEDTTASDVAAATETKTDNPATGVDDLAGLTMAALVSAGVAVLSRKHRA